MATKDTISAGTGRRKTATARVNLVKGSGKWTVNKVALEEYIPSEALRDYLKQPVAISGYDMEKVDVSTSLTFMPLRSSMRASISPIGPPPRMKALPMETLVLPKWR